MLAAGALIAGRFAIEGLLGAGGMGRVYRAIDRESGRAVALKVMIDAEPSAVDAARFAVEARALSELDHPGIVAHVAHGTTAEGLPFLAMELLVGEDLGARLRRGPLSVAEGLLLLRRAASGLDEAHRRGIVHRDLKPGNIFLRDREIDRLAIVDFGIARRMTASRALTASAALVGTPGYMAPEQVEGARDLSPAADVFALGCVLYEGLGGQAPFVSDQLVALLAKILLDEPPPLRSIAPSVPADLADLVARMMAKSPADRPAGAAAVLDALARIEAMRAGEHAGGGAPHVEHARPIALGRGELELVTVILASHRAGDHDRTLDEDVHTMAARVEAAARPELSARGAVVERLLDGSLLVTLGEPGGAAVDQAVEAAHCAWVLRSCWPEATVAVATARRPVGARIPVGEAIDRASRIGRHGDRTPSGIVLDEITAGLLGGRLRVVALGDGLSTMVDAPAPVDEERPLLGKPTPCVGREAELGTLEMSLRACLDEGSARAVLVLGPPGLGKSRLRHELLRRVDPQGAEAPLRLLGRGELLRAGTPYGILGRALRRFFGITAEVSPIEGHALIARGIEAIVPAGEQRSAAEMLGELCDVPFPDDDSVRLRAARQDPRLMQARLGEAFVTFLRGASRRGVMVVLEDLHWGDRASIELCDRALRELDDRPLFLVGFARPEVHALTPPSWKDRVLELPLRPLGKRACTRLVEGVAGDRLDAATIARVVEQSGGNALFLEELVRAACDEGPAAIPETVVAMLQTRIGRLDPAERRLLRAASIFGESFDRAGVGAVLGPAVARDDIERLFAALCREELIAPQRDEPGRYRFRHALLREAAYGLLPEDDRRLGHHLAARWLSTSEPDPAPIAEHYLLAGDPAEAAPWFVRAADRALLRENYEAATRFARRARTEGAGGELRGVLSAIEGFTAIMRVDWPAARAAAEEAEALLTPGSVHWCMAQRTASQVRAFVDDVPALMACAERFRAVDPDPEARIAYADTALFMASSSIQIGLTRQGAALIARSEAVAGDESARYPALAAWSNVIHCTLHRHTDDALGAQIRRLNEAFRLYAETGAPTVILLIARDVYAEVLARAGRVEEAIALLRAVSAELSGGGPGFVVTHNRLALANVLCEARAFADAEAHARTLLARPGLSAGYQAMARDVLAQTSAAAGDLAGAEAEARAAIALSRHTPVRRWLMVAHLGRALTGQGRAAEARAAIGEALREMDEGGTGGGFAELSLLGAAAEAAEAAGSSTEAERFTDRARRWAEKQIAGLDGDDAIRAFLAALPERARPAPVTRP